MAKRLQAVTCTSSATTSDAPSIKSLLQIMITDLLYADDAALVDKATAAASTRVNRLTEGAKKDADMEISIPKTEVMHVQE